MTAEATTTCPEEREPTEGSLGPEGRSGGDNLLAAAAALLVVSHLPAIFVSHALGLYLRFAALVAVIVAVAAVVPSAWRRVADLPRPLMLGLAGYATAALWGTALGLAAGNPLRYIASQGASMALLVLSAVVFMTRRRLAVDRILTGLAGGCVVSLLVHVAVIAFAGAYAFPEGRLVLRYGISGTGSSVLVFLVLCAALTRRPRAALFAGAVAALALAVGGMSRGAWICLGVGFSMLLLLLPGSDRRFRRLKLVAVGGALSLLVVLGLVVRFGARGGTPMAVFPDEHARPARLTTTEIRHDRIKAFPQIHPVGYGLGIRGRFQGPPGRRLVIEASSSVAGATDKRFRYWFVPGRGRWVEVGYVFVPPPDAESVDINLAVGPRQGNWLADDVRIIPLDSRALVTWYRLAWRLERLPHLLANPLTDATILYRFQELDAVLDTWRGASWRRRLMGSGLGAMVDFENTTWARDGRRTTSERASYFHNFYVFLAYKLGLLGLIALLALLAIAGWTIREAVRRDLPFDRRAILAGVGAAWIAYLLWGITSPEIYDFQVAPLWGLAIGLAERVARR